MLAKKGLWVSEFRIESGLNCGGHAFATEGLLLGPILEEFKTKRTELLDELNGLYQYALLQKQISGIKQQGIRITAQGGNVDRGMRGDGWRRPCVAVGDVNGGRRHLA